MIIACRWLRRSRLTFGHVCPVPLLRTQDFVCTIVKYQGFCFQLLLPLSNLLSYHSYPSKLRIYQSLVVGSFPPFTSRCRAPLSLGIQQAAKNKEHVTLFVSTQKRAQRVERCAAKIPPPQHRKVISSTTSPCQLLSYLASRQLRSELIVLSQASFDPVLRARPGNDGAGG